MLPAAASPVKRYHKLIYHRLDVVQSAHQLFQRFRLLFAPDTPLEPYPSALAFGSDAGVSEATVGEDSLLDAWNDLLVVEIRVRKPAAPGQEAPGTAFNPYVRLGSHLGLCDHWTLRHRTVSHPLGNLKKGIVEVIRALFGQGRSTNESYRHGSEQYWRCPRQPMLRDARFPLHASKGSGIVFAPLIAACQGQTAPHAIARTTPPSTRSAAPVVADAGTLQTYAIIAATSSGVTNR